MPAEKQTGTVARWMNRKGIGFITPEGQAPAKKGESTDILVHFSNIKQGDGEAFKSLKVGSTVEFELEKAPKEGDKDVAVNVTGPDGADCEKREPKGRGKRGAKKEEGSSDEAAEEKPKKRTRKGRGKRSAKKDDKEGSAAEEDADKDKPAKKSRKGRGKKKAEGEKKEAAEDAKDGEEKKEKKPRRSRKGKGKKSEGEAKEE